MSIEVKSGETIEITWSVSGRLGISGYSECPNGHGVWWWAMNKPPRRCDACGGRLTQKPSEFQLVCDRIEAI